MRAVATGIIRFDDYAFQRPVNRSECQDAPRPCPWISCRHHLYLEVNQETGALKINFPEVKEDVSKLDQSCSLDVADQGGLTLKQVGDVLGLTRERIRQLEVTAMKKLAGIQDSLYGEE